MEYRCSRNINVTITLQRKKTKAHRSQLSQGALMLTTTKLNEYSHNSISQDSIKLHDCDVNNSTS